MFDTLCLAGHLVPDRYLRFMLTHIGLTALSVAALSHGNSPTHSIIIDSCTYKLPQLYPKGMAVVLNPVDLIERENCLVDNWVWDKTSKSPEVLLSSDSEAAYFFIDPVNESRGTAGVRGTEGFVYGEHYWEIIFLEPPVGTSVMVGVGTQRSVLHTENYNFVNLIGMDDNSWGLSYKGTIWHGGKCWRYCEPFYDDRTVIAVHLNLYEGTISFSKNGKNLGVAFSGLNNLDEQLYPLISSTATETELAVGKRTCRYMSLQELCYLTIAKRMKHKYQGVNRLPLPMAMKNCVTDLI